MKEIFLNINAQFKNTVKTIFEIALSQPNLYYTIKVLKDFVANCTDEEKEFADFYFNMKMERLKDGNFDNKW